MALPGALFRVVAREALRFCAALGIDVKGSAPEMAEIQRIARGEYLDAGEAARIMVADKAIGLIRAVKAAIKTGEIPEAWDRGERMQQLVTTGLKQYDPRIAFQATLRSAYSAGRYQRGMEDTEDEPYFLYRTMRDSRVRSSHQVLNGVYLPKAHEFWKTHYTPNGWRCRCKVLSLDQQGIDRLTAAGLPLQDTPPEEVQVEYKDKTTGKAFKLPASIEPGWDYNPGTDEGRARLGDMLKRRMALLADPASI